MGLVKNVTDLNDFMQCGYCYAAGSTTHSPASGDMFIVLCVVYADWDGFQIAFPADSDTQHVYYRGIAGTNFKSWKKISLTTA